MVRVENAQAPRGPPEAKQQGPVLWDPWETLSMREIVEPAGRKV